MSRPLNGKEKKKHTSIRLQPRDKELIKKHFGGVQSAIDFIVRSLRSKDE